MPPKDGNQAFQVTSQDDIRTRLARWARPTAEVLVRGERFPRQYHEQDVDGRALALADEIIAELNRK